MGDSKAIAESRRKAEECFWHLFQLSFEFSTCRPGQSAVCSNMVRMFCYMNFGGLCRGLSWEILSEHFWPHKKEKEASRKNLQRDPAAQK